MNEPIPVKKLKNTPYKKSACIGCAEHCPMDIILEEISRFSDVDVLVVGVGECAYYSRKLSLSDGCLNYAYVLSNDEIVFGDTDGIADALRNMVRDGYHTVCICTCIPCLMNLNINTPATEFPSCSVVNAPGYKWISPYDVLGEMYMTLFSGVSAGNTEGIAIWDSTERSFSEIEKKATAHTHIVNYAPYLPLLMNLSERYGIDVIDNTCFHDLAYYKEYARLLGISECELEKAQHLAEKICARGILNVSGPYAVYFAEFIGKSGGKIGTVAIKSSAYNGRLAQMLRSFPESTNVIFIEQLPVENQCRFIDFSAYSREIAEKNGFSRLLLMLKIAGGEAECR